MKRYGAFLKTVEKRVSYWREVALTEFVSDLTERMRKLGLRRTDLAARLGCSRASITQTLRGDGNLTLETLVRFAMAVDGVVHIHISAPDTATTWTDQA